MNDPLTVAAIVWLLRVVAALFLSFVGVCALVWALGTESAPEPWSKP